MGDEFKKLDCILKSRVMLLTFCPKELRKLPTGIFLMWSITCLIAKNALK